MNMKDPNKDLSTKLTRIFLSFFGTGYSKFAPGTVGSIATIPLIYIISLMNLNIWVYALFIIVLTVLSCHFAQYIQSKDESHDPQWIVMDEVIGMLITWAFVYPTFDFQTISLTLVLFRIFDIVKIWPASYFDKKVTHGMGTILDDVISGLYAGLLVYLGIKYL
jgi:phosphatidylglycerophosphatase A